MMPHEPDLNQLAAFAEGTLTPAERATVVAHLVECRACRNVAGGLGRGREPTRARVPAWLLTAAATVAIGAVAGGFYWARGPAQGQAPAASMSSATDTLRSANVKHVGDKTFRLVAGEWIDAAYDPAALLPTRAISSSDELKSAIAAEPRLQLFLTLGPHFTVVVDGTVYRVNES